VTYREHRMASDRAFLSDMLKQHRTVSAVARAAGINRGTVYEIAARCGFELPPRPHYCKRSNHYWQTLESGALAS
jgi:hypothetical protein